MASKKNGPPTFYVLPEIIDYANTDKRVLAKLDAKRKSLAKGGKPHARPKKRKG
jgi:hypothetical protein